MSELVKELQMQLDHAQRLCAQKDDKINELQWFAKENKCNLDRLSKLNSVTLGFNQLITLNSPKLSPELRLLASTMYLNVDRVIRVNPAAWKRTNSHSGQIAAALGGFGAVDKVYQLPAKGGHQANIIFANPEARKAGFEALKDRFGKLAPSMKYSLQQFPKLRHQDRCLQMIFRELKEEKMIHSYSLNNFAVTSHNDFIFPLYTFRISSTKVTRYTDSRCIKAYREGFTVPVDDIHFESPEFYHLRDMIREHVDEYQIPLEQSYTSRRPALHTLADHIPIHFRDSTEDRAERQNISKVPTDAPFHFRESTEDHARDESYDAQWPKPGQNTSVTSSDTMSGTSRDSSPVSHPLEMVVYATKSSDVQSSSSSSHQTQHQGIEITNSPPRSILFKENFTFSPVLLGQPIARPINNAIGGSPPNSSDIITMQPLNISDLTS